MIITRLRPIASVLAQPVSRLAVFAAARCAAVLAALLWLPAGFAAPPETATRLRVPACQGTVVEDHSHSRSAVQAAQKCKDWKAWKKHQQDSRPKPKGGAKQAPAVPPRFPVFPPPPQAPRTLLQKIQDNMLAAAGQLLNWIGGSSAHAASGPITIDGDLSDWAPQERINLPLVFVPPALATGPELYGKYDAGNYLLAVNTGAGGAIIGSGTTIYLNIDQNVGTGDPSANGAEYAVDLFGSVPWLYRYEAPNYVGLEPLVSSAYAFSGDQRVLELSVPAASLSVTLPQSLDVVADINDAVAMPAPFTLGSFTLRGTPLPTRTDFSKRVGVVFCAATRDNFFDEKSYSQLFMSLQHQAMMAGIPFDLLTESDLTDVANIVNYDALIFPYCANVPLADLEAIHDTLYKAVYHYGIGFITADNFLTNDEFNAAIPGDAYRFMNQLLGIEYIDGTGPVASLQHNADDVSHPVMQDYVSNELILDLPGNYFNYYVGLSGQPVSQLASQTVLVNSTIGHTLDGTYPSLLAVTSDARHVHFASIELLGNSNLAWQALQWVLYGNEVPVGLKMGRNDSLFLSRNDMDQSQEHDDTFEGFTVVDVPLLSLITDWKASYDFVGSYYLNIGTYPNTPNNPTGQWTDWNVSGPLYQDYMALDNEIGTHSYTHPDNTDALVNPDGFLSEFLDSMNEISANVGPTWRTQNSRGGAVPGNPESLATAQNILGLGQLDYLTGGYSGVGAGYPGAVGYLTPTSSKVYLSPSMYFDFTLIGFGIPVGNPPVAVPLTAAEAEVFWPNQYLELLSHASQPIVVWPWHDYGPTTGSDPAKCGSTCYSVAMYTNTLQTALNSGAEFLTLADAAQRVATLKDADLTVVENVPGQTVTIAANNPNVGKFAVELGTAAGQVIQSVDNWYAYSGDKLFMDDDGGTFVVHLAASEAPLTHISALPMRARLVSLSGNGADLTYTFEGEGEVRITLPDDPANFQFTGADSTSALGPSLAGMTFNAFGTHTATVSSPDSDGDGLSNAFEVLLATDPLLVDTDGDGLSDGAEVGYDGDINQYIPGQDTNPVLADSDGDGVLDGIDPSPLVVNAGDGDLAPWNAPDAQINAADVLIAQQIVLGIRSAGPLQLMHGDIYPVGAGDDAITIQDLILIMQQVMP